MAYKPTIAVYDACVLYPFHLRNLLVQCSVDHWWRRAGPMQSIDEWIRNLAANAENLSGQRLANTRDLMKRVLPKADVTGYAKHISQLTLPDAGDRHVLAAAIASGASTIVTWNLADFPARALAPYDVSAQSPDDFLMDLYAAAPDATIAATKNARKNLRKTAPTGTQFIDALERQKLTRFAALLRKHRRKV